MDFLGSIFDPFSDENFLEKCRVCFSLKAKGKNDMSRVFDGNKNYGAQIHTLMGIQIIETQNFPALICSQCIKVLNSAMDLRKKCLEVDKKFRKMLWSYEQQSWSKNLEVIGGGEEEMDFSDIQCKIEIEDADDDETEIFDDFFAPSPVPQVKTKRPIKAERSKPKSIFNQTVSLQAEVTKCEECHKVLASRRGLRRHFQALHGKKLEKIKRSRKLRQSAHYTCDYCGIVKTTRNKIYDHVKWHSGQALRNLRSHGPCSHCGKFFKTNGELIKHEVIHKPMSERQFWYCDLCGHRFKHRGGLFAHIRTRHIAKIRFYCEKCPNVSFATKYALKQHTDFKHLNIRKHVCEYCGKGFPKKCKLTDHVRIHTGEKPFCCQYCEKRFTHQSDYIRHIWAHEGKRKYTCNLCRRGCDSKEELEVHKCPWKY